MIDLAPKNKCQNHFQGYRALFGEDLLIFAKTEMSILK